MSYFKSTRQCRRHDILVTPHKRSAVWGSALWSLVTILLLALASCQEMPEYPMEPQISYQGLSYLMNADSTLTGEVLLSIGYTDGDGDLGLDDADTLYPFGPNDPHYYNLIIDYLKWDGTAFVETPLLSWNQQTQSYDTISFNARFKRLVFNDAVKPISGTFDYTMNVLNPLSPTDTIQFRVHLIDRALHESNTIETDAISFVLSGRDGQLSRIPRALPWADGCLAFQAESPKGSQAESPTEIR